MTVESWITPEETPALAEAAAEVIQARLARLSEPERAAYWASIRKAYNTPYNDPVRKDGARRASQTRTPETPREVAPEAAPVVIAAEAVAAIPPAALIAAAEAQVA